MKDSGAKPSDVLAAFHGHLDQCRQCKEQPFSLCPRGTELLGAAGATAASQLDVKGEIGESLAGWAKCLGLVASPEGKGHFYASGGVTCIRCGAQRHGPSLIDLIVHVANGEPKGRN